MLIKVLNIYYKSNFGLTSLAAFTLVCILFYINVNNRSIMYLPSADNSHSIRSYSSAHKKIQHIEILNPRWFEMPTSEHLTCMGMYECRFTINNATNLDPNADLAIFQFTRLPLIRPNKSADQLWLLNAAEPQTFAKVDLAEWNGYFNYSFTYKRDSNRPNKWASQIFPDTLGKTIRSFDNERPTTMDLKPKVVWFVSHCSNLVRSARLEYALELSQWVHLSIFTIKLRCRRAIDSIKPNLISLLPFSEQPPLSSFHFYLSFENNLCEDYITEKFWKILEGPDLVIPIVMGGMRMEEYERTAPPNSYIHVKNFTSPKHLSEHLHYVTRHKEAFNYYLSWRNSFKLYREGM